MSLNMRICYGRTDPHKSLEVDGIEGPTLVSIESATYSNGNFFLKFSGSESLETAQSLTRWKKVNSSRQGKIFPALKTNFAFPLDTREFVSIEDQESNEVVFFSDFILYRDNPLDTMQLRLFMSESWGKSHEPEKRELIINNVESLRFTFGTYRIWLECPESRCAAEKLTDWNVGLDGMESLEMPVAPAIEAIITWDAVYQGKIPLLFDHFELKVINNNSVST